MPLTASERLLVSELLNMFVAIDWVTELPPLPPVSLSFDNPPDSGKQREQAWDLDRLLGEYHPGLDCKVTIYERGLVNCARALSLPKLALREITLLHELAHWISDQLPMKRATSIGSYVRWSDEQCHTSDGAWTSSLSGFATTSTEVHEGWSTDHFLLSVDGLR